MNSGFRHWIWYAMHSNSNFSGDGSQECERPNKDEAGRKSYSI